MAGVGESWEDLGFLDVPDNQIAIWCMLDLADGKVLTCPYTGWPSVRNQVYRSTDYGENWTPLGRPADSETGVHCLAHLGWGVVVGGTGRFGKIIRSTDYGQTWTDLGNQSLGEVRIKALVHLPDSGYALAGTGNGRQILRSVDWGENWAFVCQLGGAGGNVNCMKYLGNNIVIAGTNPFCEIFRSLDNGSTWNLAGAGGRSEVLCFADLGNGIVLAGTNANPAEVLRSTDYGATWAVATTFPMISCESLASLGNGIAIAGVAGGGNGNIFRSIDYGVSWTDLRRQYNATSINALIKLDDGRGMAGTGPAAVHCKVLRSLAPGNGGAGGIGSDSEEKKKKIALTHWEWKAKDGSKVDAYIAPEDTRCTSVFYDGRLVSISPVSRAVDDRTGLYSISDMTLELANNDKEYSKMLTKYFLKNQLIEVFQVWSNEPEASKTAVLRGIVVDYWMEGTSFFVLARDTTQKYFKMKVPPEVCT